MIQRLLLAVWLSAAACVATPPSPRPAGVGVVQVRLTGFADRGGQVLVSVFVDAAGFPDDQRRAARSVRLPVDGDSLVVTFPDVPAGELAVAAFHDVDADFQLDSNALGIPTERWGVSRGGRGLFGPPTFADSRLQLAGGAELAIDIELR
jgi:uncharacterized protein (DUF2141 family)